MNALVHSVKVSSREQSIFFLTALYHIALKTKVDGNAENWKDCVIAPIIATPQKNVNQHWGDYINTFAQEKGTNDTNRQISIIMFSSLKALLFHLQIHQIILEYYFFFLFLCFSNHLLNITRCCEDCHWANTL